jgi:hypothetical protein
MSAVDKLKPEHTALLAPLGAHPGWKPLMNKNLIALVLAGKADPNEAAAFILARLASSTLPGVQYRDEAEALEERLCGKQKEAK